MSNKRLEPENDDELAKRKEALEQAERKRKQLKSDRELLLKMPEFQRYMADIIARGGMFRTCMTGNSMTYHLSGRQDFTREIWSELAATNQNLAFELLKPKFGEKHDG